MGVAFVIDHVSSDDRRGKGTSSAAIHHLGVGAAAGLGHDPTMNLRWADDTDVDQIAAVLLQKNDESICRSTAIDTEKGASYLRFCIDSPGHFCAVWRNDERALCGIIIGFMNKYLFSYELSAWDLLVYVRPQDRGSRVAVDLLSGFKAWSEQSRGLPLWLGRSSTIAPESVRRFYTGLGMTDADVLNQMCNYSGRARSFHKAFYGYGVLVPWRDEKPERIWD